MKTIKKLTDILDLDTVYQTRNRINAIHDILEDHIKRGDNNQLLVNSTGVEMLKRLQDMYESGLLLDEAADIVRSEYPMEGGSGSSEDLSGSDTDQTKAGENEFRRHLIEEIEFLRSRLGEMKEANEKKESEAFSEVDLTEADGEPWWYDWL